MPEKYRVIGSAPAQFALSTEEFREHARQAAEQFGTSKPEGEAWDAFAANLSFGQRGSGQDRPLAGAIKEAEKRSAARPGACSTWRSRRRRSSPWSR